MAEPRDAPHSSATAPSVPAPSIAAPSVPAPSAAGMAEAALDTMNAKEALELLASACDTIGGGAAAPVSATAAADEMFAAPWGEVAAVIGAEAAAVPAKDTPVAAPVAAAPAPESTTAPSAAGTGAAPSPAAETETEATLPALAVVGQRVQIVYSGQPRDAADVGYVFKVRTPPPLKHIALRL